jgi:SAM-dependent methyltransferase
MAHPLETGRYLLGDEACEIVRLGEQHRLWREHALEGWRGAGIGAGARVVDVGAGPGWATEDLAALVGPQGHVTAVERSPDFLAALRDRVARAHTNVSVHEVDLMRDAIPIGHGLHDAAWCRWVAMFVPNIDLLVGRIAASLRSGGVAVFHEYANCHTYGTLPRRVEVEDFVSRAIQGLKECGGTVNAASPVIAALPKHNLELVQVRPLPVVARPSEPFWRWPSEFIRTFAPKLVALGLADDAWHGRLIAAIDEAASDPNSVFIGPFNVEIVARLERPRP